MKRCFIALEIPAATRERLGAMAQEIGRCTGAQKIRPVAPERMHLTLKFLGPTPEAQLEDLRGVMEAEASTLPPLPLAGLGAFPQVHRPRILFATLATASAEGHVRDLMLRLEKGCATLGFAPEKRAPHPHVTLARIERPLVRGPLTALIERHAQEAWGEVSRAQLLLLQSTLHPKGAIYSPLLAVPLPGGQP